MTAQHNLGAHAIARYLNIQAAYNPAFFSNGEYIAFLSNITGVPQVWRVSVPGPGEPLAWPDQLTFREERVQGVLCSPAPGDDRLIYTRDVGGNEMGQLFLLDPAAGSESPAGNHRSQGG